MTDLQQRIERVPEEANLHCSECGLNWPPARIEDGSGNPTNQVRCVECKSVHQRPVATETLKQMRSENAG